MRSMMQRLWHNKRGQALPLVVLMLPVLVGVAGLSVTVGTVYTAQAKLQNSVDAAALAGAQEMAKQTAVSPANQASLITANDPGASHVTITTVQSPVGPAVLASAEVTVPGSFAALFGHKSFTIRTHAEAVYGAGQAFNFAVFQGDSNPSGQELVLNGNDKVAGEDGVAASVHSNNDLLINGHVSVTGSCGGNPAVTLNGDTSCAEGTINNAPEIPMPNWTPAQTAPQDATTVGSASDPSGLTVSGGDSLNGNYIIYGNLVINGNAQVNGHFVVIGGNIVINGDATMTGSLVDYGGSITLNGNVSQTSTNGLAIAAFSSNGQPTSGTAGSITLNGNVTVNSILYAPDNNITLNGRVSVNGAVVGYHDTLNGNIKVNYSGTEVEAAPVQQVALIQ